MTYQSARGSRATCIPRGWMGQFRSRSEFKLIGEPGEKVSIKETWIELCLSFSVEWILMNLYVNIMSIFKKLTLNNLKTNSKVPQISPVLDCRRLNRPPRRKNSNSKQCITGIASDPTHNMADLSPRKRLVLCILIASARSASRV